MNIIITLSLCCFSACVGFMVCAIMVSAKRGCIEDSLPPIPPLAEIPLSDERDLFMGRNQGGRP